MAHATTEEYGATIVPELTAIDALKRWDGMDTTNVDEAYEAGRKAEREAWLQQTRQVRNYSAPDDVFEAVPVRVMGGERSNHKIEISNDST